MFELTLNLLEHEREDWARIDVKNLEAVSKARAYLEKHEEDLRISGEMLSKIHGQINRLKAVERE